MLEPRETDLFALFLVLVVLSLVIYIFLGKCSEATKKKEMIGSLAQLAADEALREEAMAAVIPFVPALKNVIHECARCSNPATTRCSQCKSVHYCSGKCQIIHWRQVHKHECQQLEANSCSSLHVAVSNEQSVRESFLLNDKQSSESPGYKSKHPVQEKAFRDDRIYHSTGPAASAAADCTSVNTYEVPTSESRSTDRQVFHKSKLRRDDGAVIDSTEEASRSRIASSTSTNKESYMRHKLRNSAPVLSEEKTPRKPDVNISGCSVNGQTSWRSAMHENHDLPTQHGDVLDSRTSLVIAGSLSSAKPGVIMSDIERDFMSGGGNFLGEGITFSDETVDSSYSSDMTSMRKGIRDRSASHPSGTKMHKSQKKTMKVAKERLCSETERNGQIANGSKVNRLRDSISAHGSNGASSMGIVMMIGPRKPSKLGRKEASEVVEEHNKLNMLFPYEEFVKFFQYEDFNFSPRGLINCGNSCYANAVLQCLAYTKPLTIYLLQSLHSRACCKKDWCLTCELEQHVMMLRDTGGLLSAGRILSHMRSTNCQIGDGNQEDAHEFLRILVTSMQSISLEGFGGENTVDPGLQETTFIQHTFGGYLKSKVNCLRCHHESERYENIMDLTLEIFGWVESLEDALTQFTNPEDLDGENMYRCGRCAAYVRATKQLSIQEAPNILTIVLKRFQEGSYGKINKRITFPDMLDMVPFMTGTDDIPPVYMLYAIVVHMDTLNASFSGHYISYVTDLRGSWFRVDDTEVQPVPMSQVMSERAYILFYKRSCPRPVSQKHAWNQPPGFAKHLTSKNPSSSRPGQSKSSGPFVSTEPSSNHRSDQNSNGMVRSVNRSRPSSMEFLDAVSSDFSFVTSSNMEFSDAVSSDCSFFTSSDEASFTTESTRDSFSTVDYADAYNTDPISSIFSTKHRPESSSTQPLNGVQKGGNVKAVTGSSTKAFLSDRNFGFNTKFGSNLKEATQQTFDHFIL